MHCMDAIGSQEERQGVKRASVSILAQTLTNAPRGPETVSGGVFVDTSERTGDGVGSAPIGTVQTPSQSGLRLLSSYMEVKSGTRVCLCDQKSDLAESKVLSDVTKFATRKSGTLRIVGPLSRHDTDRAAKLSKCGGAIAFRYWIDHDRSTMHTANWCNMPRLCQCCAHARGIKLAKQASGKVSHLLNDDRDLRPWLVTFTVKNGRDLPERLEHLTSSFGKGWQRRKNHEKGKRHRSAFNAVAGSIYSAEIKRGKNSGQWHVHLHCLFLVPASVWRWEEGKTGLQLEANAHRQLCDEWHEITGDSFVINAKPLRSAVDMESGEPVREEYLTAELFEVFKYLTKPSETLPVDVVEAWRVTQGKRLVRSHGNLVGLKMPETLDGELLGGDAWEIWYRWQQGRYQRQTVKFVPGETSDDRTKSAA